jgi:catechol 2,3-dioxygenase-like lactoylglutathione lyase family enzyme
MKTTAAALAATLALAGAASAAPPPALMPHAVAGAGWNVADLEAQRAWYADKLGMKLVNTIMRDGKPREYVMGYGGPDGAVIALLAAPRPPGPNQMGRLILDVPDAKGLAAHLATVGVPNREVVAGVAYFITDPEGNPIELYTPPAK